MTVPCQGCLTMSVVSLFTPNRDTQEYCLLPFSDAYSDNHGQKRPWCDQHRGTQIWTKSWDLIAKAGQMPALKSQRSRRSFNTRWGAGQKGKLPLGMPTAPADGCSTSIPASCYTHPEKQHYLSLPCHPHKSATLKFVVLVSARKVLTVGSLGDKSVTLPF